MPRFLLIAICSLVCVASVEAGPPGSSGILAVTWSTGTTAGTIRASAAWTHTGPETSPTQTSFYYRIKARRIRADGTYTDSTTSVGTLATGGLFTTSNQSTAGYASIQLIVERQVNFVYVAYGTYYATWDADGNPIDGGSDRDPEPDSLEFDWTFGSEWGGAVLEIVSATGVSLYTATIPIGGGDVAGVVYADDLEGAQIIIDGYGVGDLDGNAPLSAVDADRPGYALSFDPSYLGKAWEIRRQDGSVAASGTGATEAILTGRFAVAGGETATLYIEQALPDGMGSQMVPLNVTFQGANITNYSLVGNPSDRPASGMPTPAPVAPAPTNPDAPGNAAIPQSTPVPAPSPDEIADIDVGEVDLPDADDGEEDVLSSLSQVQALVAGIVEDLATTQANLVDAMDQLNGLRLGGVGSNCTFNMGPAQITLQTNGAVRTGLKLLILGMGAFAAASMIRDALS